MARYRWVAGESGSGQKGADRGEYGTSARLRFQSPASEKGLTLGASRPGPRDGAAYVKSSVACAFPNLFEHRLNRPLAQRSAKFRFGESPAALRHFGVRPPSARTFQVPRSRCYQRGNAAGCDRGASADSRRQGQACPFQRPALERGTARSGRSPAARASCDQRRLKGALPWLVLPVKTTASADETLPPGAVSESLKSGWLNVLPLGLLARANAGCALPSEPNDDEM